MNVDPDTQLFLSGEDPVLHEASEEQNINNSKRNTEITHGGHVS